VNPITAKTEVHGYRYDNSAPSESDSFGGSSMSATTQDRAGLDPAKFSATPVKTPGPLHNLTVSGEAVGDYRVEDVKLVRSRRQVVPRILVLDLVENLGPVIDPHPELERVWPLHYTEHPAKCDYTEIKIVDGPQHFTVSVIDVP
jgi:hypothetical protein